MVTNHTTPSIDRTPLGIYVTMPVPRVGCVIVFMIAWLIGWAFGEFWALFAILGITTSFFAGTVFLAFWLIGWTAAGVVAAATLLMTLDGREVLSIGSGVIRRRAEAFGRGLSWRYPLEKCSNLRPTSSSDATSGFISFERARSSAVLMIFWTAFSFSMAFPSVDCREGSFP